MSPAPSPLPAKPRSGLPVIIVGLVGMASLSAWHLGFVQIFDRETGTKLAEFFSRFSHPEWRVLPSGIALMGQTIAIGFWATLIAAIFASIFAPLSTRPIAPRRAYRIARETMNFFRALPDFLLTLFLLNVLELGPWPATLAVGLHSGANLGKFLAENMERVDKGIYESAIASGAGFGHLAVFVAWPMTLRELVSFTLFIFDRNVRMATILGVVGAGGIGAALKMTLGIRNYTYAAAFIAIIIVTVLAIDIVSNALRRRLA